MTDNDTILEVEATEVDRPRGRRAGGRPARSPSATCWNASSARARAWAPSWSAPPPTCPRRSRTRRPPSSTKFAVAQHCPPPSPTPAPRCGTSSPAPAPGCAPPIGEYVGNQATLPNAVVVGAADVAEAVLRAQGTVAATAVDSAFTVATIAARGGDVSGRRQRRTTRDRRADGRRARPTSPARGNVPPRRSAAPSPTTTSTSRPSPTTTEPVCSADPAGWRDYARRVPPSGPDGVSWPCPPASPSLPWPAAPTNPAR